MYKVAGIQLKKIIIKGLDRSQNQQPFKHKRNPFWEKKKPFGGERERR